MRILAKLPSARSLMLIEPDIPFSHAFPDGGIITVNRDIEKIVTSIARYSHKDAATWRVLMNRFLAEKDTITKAMFSPPPSLPEAATAFAKSSAGWRPTDSACRMSGRGRTRPSKQRRRKR